MNPLRILIATQSYHPRCSGIGEHVRHLGLTLRGRGHQVRILTSGPRPRGGELPGLDVLRIGRRLEVPSNGTRASIAFHPTYRRAVRSVLADGLDLVHIHSPLEPFLPWAVLQEASVPCVGTFHNAGAVHPGYRFFSRWLAPLAEKLHLRLAVSRCAAEYAGRHFPGEYVLIPNGVDPLRFRPPERSRGVKKPTVLFVGGLEPRKGLDVLVDGVALATGRLGTPVRLLVVGDGSRRQRFLREAQRARIDFQWCGVVDPGHLPEVYRQADLLAAPALHGESFGIVLLEALASGLPVVASRIEGFEEVLSGCPCARLFTPGDPEALAERIAEVVRERPNPAEARRYASDYAWDLLGSRIEASYREVLGGPRADVPRIRFSMESLVFASQRLHP